MIHEGHSGATQYGIDGQSVGFDHEELKLLLSKEEAVAVNGTVPLVSCRNDAVDWIVMVNRHYSFSCLTAVLAVNYFDRFLSAQLQLDKPWMIQLAAVACLSLAAKVEETRVPLLVDFQVEECAYYFEAKTIEKMEMLVLSTLDWKMHPVTAISFFHCFISGFGLQCFLSVEFLRRCEGVILSIIRDHRLTRFPPSIVAAATMMQVVETAGAGSDAGHVLQFEIQLLSTLGIEKIIFEECLSLIKELCAKNGRDQRKKRSFSAISDAPRSPDGVIEISYSSDSSDDSWDLRSSSSSSPSSSRETMTKKCKLFCSSTNGSFSVP